MAVSDKLKAHTPQFLSVSEIASLFGYSEQSILEIIEHRSAPVHQEFFSISELANRWRCSRGTVYNRLRAAGAIALDFTGRRQTRSKRSIQRSVVLDIESKFSKRFS
jgi:predicted DNA-binding protein YlxM (UPF0122 family)